MNSCCFSGIDLGNKNTISRYFLQEMHALERDPTWSRDTALRLGLLSEKINEERVQLGEANLSSKL